MNRRQFLRSSIVAAAGVAVAPAAVLARSPGPAVSGIAMVTSPTIGEALLQRTASQIMAEIAEMDAMGAMLAQRMNLKRDAIMRSVLLSRNLDPDDYLSGVHAAHDINPESGSSCIE